MSRSSSFAHQNLNPLVLRNKDRFFRTYRLPLSLAALDFTVLLLRLPRKDSSPKGNEGSEG